MLHGAQGPLQPQVSGNAEGAWCLGEGTPTCALWLGWCVPCAIQGQLTDPAECRMKSHCQWHVSVELGYLFSDSTSVDQS